MSPQIRSSHLAALREATIHGFAEDGILGVMSIVDIFPRNNNNDKIFDNARFDNQIAPCMQQCFCPGHSNSWKPDAINTSK